MEQFDVIVSGIVTTDVIFSDIPKLPDPGEEVYCGGFEFTCGAAYNTAVAMARLGMKVAMVAPIGNDLLSKFVMESLESEGVSTQYMKQLNRSLPILSVALNYGGDRSFISYEESLGDFDFEEYANSIMHQVDAKILHIDAGPDSKSVIQYAKEKGILISLDVGWNESWLKDARLKEIIKMGDFFTPNLKESLVLTGETTAEGAINKLSELNPKNHVIIKLGKEGALLKENGEITKINGYQRNVVDTTGAGDVFSAGMLTGIIKKFNLTDAVKLGNFCGGCSVEGMGGTAKSPHWDRVLNDFFIK